MHTVTAAYETGPCRGSEGVLMAAAHASPSYGLDVGPNIMTLKYRRLSSDGDALIPGAAVTKQRAVQCRCKSGKALKPVSRKARHCMINHLLTWLRQQPLCLL